MIAIVSREKKKTSQNTNLSDVGVIGPRDELLELSESASLGECVDQFSLNVRFAALLAGHLQVAHEVFPVVCKYNAYYTTLCVLSI